MQKGFTQTLLILIIALFIFIALGIYWFNFKDSSYNSSDKLVPPLPPTQEQMKQNQQYKNETLGFEFTVPDGYYVFEENEEQFHKRSNGEMRKNFNSTLYYPPAQFITSLYLIDEEKDFDKSPLSIWVFENPENLDAAGFYKKYWYYPFIWGDFTSAKEKIAPENMELIGGKEGMSGVVNYREGKPKFIYLPLEDKDLMLQIQFPTQNNEEGKHILESLKFE